MAREKLHPSLKHSEFTLDDISFPPLKIPDFEARDVDLSTRLTDRLTLRIPLMSSPMDTVTEHQMAILMALQGGIGVIHYNFPTIEDQMKEVTRVRKFEAGFIRNPVVLGKDISVGKVFEEAEKHGFFSFPITEDGTLETKMIGIVTRRDVRHQEDMSLNITAVMTRAENLKVAHRRDTLDINDIRLANKLIRDFNLDTLPIIDDDFKIVALVTDSDLAKDKRYPLATKDNNKQLQVLVAVESRLEAAKERIKAAAEFGAAGIVIDARNIFVDHLQIAKWVKHEAPELDVIIGNAVTFEVIDSAMKEAGDSIDAFRIGIGGGEVCISTESLGIGRPLGSSIFETSRAVDEAVKKYCKDSHRHVGVIADGGVKMYPAHIVGALMLGADVVMMGSELAAMTESPRPEQWDPDSNQLVKYVRGMGSAEVMQERAGGNRYMVDKTSFLNRFPEGKKKQIPYKGDGEDHIKTLFMGVKQAFHGLGHRTIEDLQRDGYIIPFRRAASKGSL